MSLHKHIFMKIALFLNILFLFSISFLFGCTSDDKLREKEINSILESKFGANAKFRYESIEYRDSILSNPLDFACLSAASKFLNVYDRYINRIDSFRQELLIYLKKDKGEVVLSIDSLPNSIQQSYKQMINEMRLSLRQFQETSKIIHEFVPHSIIREFRTIDVLNDDKHKKKYWGVFYFKENELTNFFIIENNKVNELVSIISNSIDGDKNFISLPLKKLGIKVNEKSVSLLEKQSREIPFIWDLQSEEYNVIELTRLNSETQAIEPKIVVPVFTILKREREDYNEFTPRTRFHIRTPKLYTENELNLIADSLLEKEKKENRINEIWVNYYLPKKKIHYSNSYGLSVRLRTENSSTVFQNEKRKLGYNPPKARDLSGTNNRAQQLWGAFDSGLIMGYEVGYEDGKKKRKVYHSFDSYYPSADEWIEQSYKQGYEEGYLQGFDDAGGVR